MPETAKLVVGCDLGATNTRLAVVATNNGRLLHRAQIASTVGEYKQTVQEVAAQISSLVRRQPLHAVGVAVAGQLSPNRSSVVVAPNLKWSNRAFARDLSRALSGTRVVLQNDVRAAARGELAFGALAAVKQAICLFWGSGIGGAIVSEGRVQLGAMALAGEIGHLTFKSSGKLCACGKKGCYEAYSGGHVLNATAHRLLGPSARATDLWLAKDPRATAAAELAEHAVGQLIGNLVTAFDPEVVVIGGALGLKFFTRLRQSAAPHLLPARKGKLRLVRTALGDDAGLLGAALGAADELG